MSKTIAAVAVKLLVGGLQYVVLKVCLDWPSQGLSGDECKGVEEGEKKAFKKNFLFGVITFASMLFVILPYFYKECRDFARSRQLSGLPAKHPYSRRAYMLTMTPAVLDVVAVILSLYSNKFIPATTMIILKSMRIVISAFLSKFILHKAQMPYQWMGVLITTLGLLPIFIVDFLRHNEEDAAKKAYFKHMGKADKKDKEGSASMAYVLVIIAEFMRAIRYLLEERLMKMESMSAEFVVYMESLVGFVISLLAMIGAHYITAPSLAKNCGRMEHMGDTWAMMKSEWMLWLLLSLHFVFVGVSNYATTLVTKYTSSVLNSILSQARTIVVWLPCVILGFVAEREYAFTDLDGNYHPGNAKFGEPFDRWVPLVFVGFGVVTCGALVYSGDLKLPGNRCQPEPKKPKKVSAVESPSTSHAVEHTNTVSHNAI